MPETLTIQQASARTGLSPDTLRYYERVGLIAGIGRAASGHRRYAPDDLVWIAFLKRLRATGMPIADMRRFAELRRRGPASLEQRRRLLEAHERRVAERIAELGGHREAIRAKLERLERQEETDAEPAP